jgi:type II secretory pathway pseudopilin PulG
MAGALTAGGAAVLGVLLAGTLAVQVRAETVERRNQEAMKALGFNLDDFFLDVSRYPSREEGLAALVTGDPDGDGTSIPGWRGPYLQLDGSRVRYDRLNNTFLDAWGQPVIYWAHPDQTWVYAASAGVNRRFDTPSLGEAGFSGQLEGDDLITWVEGP